jgi:hypothetical protein
VEFDPSKIYEAELEAGEKWVDTDHAARLLEEQRKSVLAEIMLDSPSSTNAAKEMEALASKQYRQYVLDMCIAKREANRSKVRYDAIKTLADNRRTQSVNQRLGA